MSKTMKGGSQKTKAKGGSQKTMSMTKTASSTYSRIGDNIYFDGYSYRVRVSVDGVRYSKNFSSKNKAYAYRKQLLEGRG